METLKKRKDFLACSRAPRWAAPGLVLQGRNRDDAGPTRVGYTCSKKVGNAVTRNRAKRRLRAAAQKIIMNQGLGGWDYVLIGRTDATVGRPFAALLVDLETALGRVHAPRKPKT